MFEDRPPDSAAGPWIHPASSGVAAHQPFAQGSYTHQSPPVPSTATSPCLQSPPAHTAYSDNSLSASQQTPWWLRESRKHISPEQVKMSIPLGSPSDVKRNSRTRPAASTSDPAHAGTASPYTADPSMYPVRTAPSNTSIGRTGPIHLQTRLSKRERALWIWLNVEDLDSFLQDVRP